MLMLNKGSTARTALMAWTMMASCVMAQLELPTDYPYCSVVGMKWQTGNPPYSVSIVGPSGEIYQSVETGETEINWGVTLDEQTNFNVHWSDQAGQIIESDRYTVIAGPSGCIVTDRGAWQEECQAETTREEGGRIVTVTETITAPTPVVTKTVCNYCAGDDDDDDGETVTVTEATSGGSGLSIFKTALFAGFVVAAVVGWA